FIVRAIGTAIHLVHGDPPRRCWKRPAPSRVQRSDPGGAGEVEKEPPMNCGGDGRRHPRCVGAAYFVRGSSGSAGSSVAPGGGVPLPERTYSARRRAYSSGVNSSRSVLPPSVAPPAAACACSCLRKGMHQPQPVPAPPHCESM